MWNELTQWISASPYKVLSLALVAGLLVHVLVWFAISLIARRTQSIFDDALVAYLKAPTRWFLPLVALHFTLPYFKVQLNDASYILMANLLSALTIALVAWVLIRLGAVLQKVVMSQQALDSSDNQGARRIFTQVQILRKVFSFVVVVVSAGFIFMSFDEFRRIGAGILASAGIVGVILGLAAQRTLGNLLAGIQIAITQPIRHDDVVVVENEWGVIEEITLTFVVVRIWDLRRLIVPISHFLEKPFQNWTHRSAKVLGTVFFWVDYSVPIDKLRALVSAASGAICWDLRAEVREKLLAFVQKNYPASLPVLRAEIKSV